MNLRRRQREHAEVSTESLNDIMFFLLLFFLILSTLVSPNVINLTLPNSKSSETHPNEKIIITVSKDLDYYIGTKQVRFDELEPALTYELKKNPGNQNVFLRLDQGLKIQDLVDLLTLGQKLKVKMILATKANSR